MINMRKNKDGEYAILGIPYAQYLKGDLTSLAAEVKLNPRKGEITLVVAGNDGPPEQAALDPERLIDLARNDPRPVKVLAAELAAQYGRGRNELYQLILRARQEPAK